MKTSTGGCFGAEWHAPAVYAGYFGGDDPAVYAKAKRDGDAQFAPDQSQSALCAGHPPNFGDRCEGLGGRGLRLAGIVNELLIYARHLAGPFLVMRSDLLATFVFANSGAAAGVKSKLDLFAGLMVLALCDGERGRNCYTRPAYRRGFRLPPYTTGVIWSSVSWLAW